jgi:RES domain-containing protein
MARASQKNPKGTFEIDQREGPPSVNPATYQLLGIDVPDDFAVETLSLTDIERISQDWADDPRVTRGLLRPWFDEARTATVSVPSVIPPFAQNYVINPRHKDAARIRVSHVAHYPHDPRLSGGA